VELSAAPSALPSSSGRPSGSGPLRTKVRLPCGPQTPCAVTAPPLLSPTNPPGKMSLIEAAIGSDIPPRPLPGLPPPRQRRAGQEFLLPLRQCWSSVRGCVAPLDSLSSRIPPPDSAPPSLFTPFLSLPSRHSHSPVLPSVVLLQCFFILLPPARPPSSSVSTRSGAWSRLGAR